MADSRKYISSEELKNHNKPGDLWISIEGKVYDVSDWVKEHPGGDFLLLNLAGQDITDAFVAYHPATSWQYLDKFFNGFYLKDYSASEVSKDYRRLVSEFTKLGLFEKKGHVCLFTMCLMAMLFAISVYGILCCQSVLAHLISGGLMGCLWIQSGWIGHDSGHCQVMSTPGLNRFAQVLTRNCLAGISIAWWKWNHNAHHIACNFSTCHSLRFTVTGIQHVQFCLNHFSSEIYVAPPKGNDWFEKQTNGSLDISCPSWMEWFHGGLQFQIEHHLFPRLPIYQLRKVSPFVKDLCKKHGLPYNCASFLKANALTISTLRAAALQARDLTKPVPKNLVWEAVNTHG